ncbi:MAG: AIM24 family protein [Clostridiaceae bacterium]|nr:AIM24 family protein [Clostridiaceae bacterium]
MNYSIEGGSLPVVRIFLNQGESLVSEAGGRTWARGPVRTETESGGGFGKMFGRMMSGESLFLSTYTAQGPCEIAFASSFPGKIIPYELAPGQSIIAQKSAFLCATAGVDLSIYFQKKFGAGLAGGEGFIMQKITGPGLAFFEIDGHSVEYDLQPGEQIVTDTGVVALMDTTCQMDVQMIRGVKNVLFGGEGLFDTVVTGPGKVHLQTITLGGLAKLLSPFIDRK